MLVCNFIIHQTETYAQVGLTDEAHISLTPPNMKSDHTCTVYILTVENDQIYPRGKGGTNKRDIENAPILQLRGGAKVSGTVKSSLVVARRNEQLQT